VVEALNTVAEKFFSVGQSWAEMEKDMLKSFFNLWARKLLPSPQEFERFDSG
jgi:hypothetical protein